MEETRKLEIERRRAETRLMWIPGVMPLIVPAIIPKKSASIISRSISMIIY